MLRSAQLLPDFFVASSLLMLHLGILRPFCDVSSYTTSLLLWHFPTLSVFLWRDRPATRRKMSDDKPAKRGSNVGTQLKAHSRNASIKIESWGRRSFIPRFLCSPPSFFSRWFFTTFPAWVIHSREWNRKQANAYQWRVKSKQRMNYCCSFRLLRQRKKAKSPFR